jgi:CDP-glycerol glycerophosphotransferase (TagB/SpsB family)
MLQPHANIFHKDKRVTFLPMQTSYRQVFAISSLMVTDYSSAVFDFSYLRKPVIYCQFDKERFFSGEHTVKLGYFDYEKDGFGEVVYDLDSTIDLIIEYVMNECRLKDMYNERIDSFFAFNDRNNCRRVIDKILKLPEKY